MPHSGLHCPQVPVSGGMEAGAAANVLRRYVAVVPLAAGQLLWRVGDPANDFFVIEKGVVRVRQMTVQFVWWVRCWVENP